MTIEYRDIKVPQGANFVEIFPIDVDDPDTGDPINLSGFDGFMQARDMPGSAVVLADFDVDVDAIGRRAIVTLTAALSEVMIWNVGVYDLVINSGSDTYRIAEGSISLSKRITELV